jgi:hypothetical protein
MKLRWLYAASVALLALTSTAALAQGRGHGRGHGDNRGAPPGQVKKAERANDAHFRDQDRQYADNWSQHYYNQHRDLPPGLRDRDRLPPGIAGRVRPGWVVEPAYRPRLYPVPVVLVRRFAPPPAGCRYMFFDGRVVLVDPRYRVVDMLQLNINLGR